MRENNKMILLPKDTRDKNKKGANVHRSCANLSDSRPPFDNRNGHMSIFTPFDCHNSQEIRKWSDEAAGDRYIDGGEDSRNGKTRATVQ